MSFKEKVYDAYYRSVAEKIDQLLQTLQDLNGSSNNETKSSAGDKYETTREMLRMEKEKISAQLSEAKQQKILLEQGNNSTSSAIIQRGSLVKTSKGYLYINIALGKIVVDDVFIFSVSPHAPLGSKLIGLQAQDTLIFNNISYLIEAVF